MKSLFKKKKKADGSSAAPSPDPAAHPQAGRYRSEAVQRVPGTTTAPPQLVIGDQKPLVPPFGGEGLHANTVYEVRRRPPSPRARKPASKGEPWESVWLAGKKKEKGEISLGDGTQGFFFG